jgi:hypothetical protein
MAGQQPSSSSHTCSHPSLVFYAHLQARATTVQQDFAQAGLDRDLGLTRCLHKLHWPNVCNAHERAAERTLSVVLTSWRMVAHVLLPIVRQYVSQSQGGVGCPPVACGLLYSRCRVNQFSTRSKTQCQRSSLKLCSSGSRNPGRRLSGQQSINHISSRCPWPI